MILCYYTGSIKQERNYSEERHSLLLDAANFIETIEMRQGVTISAPEEIAYINGFITTEQLLQSAALYGKSPYGEHLKAVAEGRVKY